MEVISSIIKVIGSSEAITKFYANGLLSVMIKEAALLDTEFILETKKVMDSLKIDKKFFVISESQGFYRVSQEARQLSASREISDNIGAVAVVTNISTRLIFDLYTKINKPFVMTKAFTRREIALQWLKEQMGDQWHITGATA
jgi:hypothetical protein